MLFEFGYKRQTGEFVRNRYGTATEVVSWANKIKTDVYCSIFGFPDHKLKNAGPLSGSFYFDLDCEGDISKAHTDLKALIELFEIQGVKPTDMRLFFSGFKGFHVVFDPTASQLPNTTNKNEVFREIAIQVNDHLPNKTADLAIYDTRRVFRIANTINSKSGLYKILINYPLLPLDQILELAKTPQPFNPVAQQPNFVIRGIYDNAERDMVAKLQPKHTPTVYPSKSIAPQVLEQIIQGKPQGQRDAGAFYIVKYLQSKGFSKNEAEPLLIQYARNCTPPFSEREINYKLIKNYGYISK